jgi:acyl-CoA oxidase
MSPQIYKEIPAHLAEQRSTKGTRMLEIERAKASFSVDALKTYLHGQQYLDQLNKILPVLENEVSPLPFDWLISSLK